MTTNLFVFSQYFLYHFVYQPISLSSFDDYSTSYFVYIYQAIHDSGTFKRVNVYMNVHIILYFIFCKDFFYSHISIQTTEHSNKRRI